MFADIYFEKAGGHGHEMLPEAMAGEMPLGLRQPALALNEFKASQLREPSRFRGFYGAARVAEAGGDRQKAAYYFGQLEAPTKNGDGTRPELARAAAYLARR
jgi:hypothetical protein